MFREFNELNELRKVETKKTEAVRLCKEMMEINEKEIPHRIKYNTEYWTQELKKTYNVKFHRFAFICNDLSKGEIIKLIEPLLKNYKLNPDNLFCFK